MRSIIFAMQYAADEPVLNQPVIVLPLLSGKARETGKTLLLVVSLYCLVNLATAEIDDALQVLTDQATPQPFYPVSVDRINLAKSEIASVLAAPTFVQRQGPLSNAISRVQNARDQIGANITFRLGTANLMF